MENIVINVNPGICGFDCRVKARQSGKRIARVRVTGSECTMIQNLANHLNDISLKDLFTPLTKNPIFMAAEQAGCHLACPVPVAVVKACEVALELAVPKDAGINFLK
ncbi:MAG: hypothetical protein GXP56_04775 [Deltaproteobacteria bacterium]|nr:hypothetical protein [Deltaproteobacteria bacterium]